jgi:hypothetical protein
MDKMRLKKVIPEKLFFGQKNGDVVAQLVKATGRHQN